MRRLCAVVVVLLALVAVGPRAVAEVGLPPGVPPVAGQVVDDYAPPANRWDPGHRGIDVEAPAGTVVVAAAAGTVTYAGVLAGRGVVVVDHGTVRTTYEPVDASVSVGDEVGAGSPIGRIGSGGHCSAACLHWGLRSGSSYLDPRLLLAIPIRLLSASEPVAPPRQGMGSSAALVRPAIGPVASAYGWRIHPTLGTHRFHDGIDYGAPCGSPISAAAGGVVIWRGYDDAYGNRLLVEHGQVPGTGGRVVTSYNHAESYDVRVGDVVGQGERLGTVGSTGWSTGCHLHFSVWVDGDLVDPAQVV